MSYRIALPLLVIITFGCARTDPTSDGLVGAYTATVFQITHSGQAPVDVISAGGSLHITITADNTTTGTLFVPASAAGGADFTESMNGTVTNVGGTVRFQQSADTFVRDLEWTLGEGSLTVISQLLAGTVFTIAMTRE